MKITVTFDSLEEFDAFRGAFPAKARQRIKEFQKEAEEPEDTPMNDLPKNPPEPAEKPVDTRTGAIVGATPEEQKQIEAEEKAAPVYALADAQKAISDFIETNPTAVSPLLEKNQDLKEAPADPEPAAEPVAADKKSREGSR